MKSEELYSLNIFKSINNGIIEKINDPNDPEIVLFGLILVNFLPPIILPTIYPPVSENAQSDRMKNKYIEEFLCNS